jgi:hypothetical protein
VLGTILTPETRMRAAALTSAANSLPNQPPITVAGTIRTDGAIVTATLLFDAVSRGRPSVPA